MREKIKFALTNADLIISGIMLCVLVVCTFLGVIMRYFFNNPFNWLEEVQLLCQVWIVFCGGMAAFRFNDHIEIEFIADSLPEIGQKILYAMKTAVIVGILGYLGYQAWRYLEVFAMSGRTTIVLGINYILIYIIVPISIILMIASYLTTIKETWHNIELNAQEKIRAKENEVKK